MARHKNDQLIITAIQCIYVYIYIYIYIYIESMNSTREPNKVAITRPMWPWICNGSRLEIFYKTLHAWRHCLRRNLKLINYSLPVIKRCNDLADKLYRCDIYSYIPLYAIICGGSITTVNTNIKHLCNPWPYFEIVYFDNHGIPI